MWAFACAYTLAFCLAVLIHCLAHAFHNYPYSYTYHGLCNQRQHCWCRNSQLGCERRKCSTILADWITSLDFEVWTGHLEYVASKILHFFPVSWQHHVFVLWLPHPYPQRSAAVLEFKTTIDQAVSVWTIRMTEGLACLCLHRQSEDCLSHPPGSRMSSLPWAFVSFIRTVL